MRPRSEYEEAMRWLDFGLSRREVGRALGIPMGTIASWRRYGYGSRKSGPNHSLAQYEEAMRYVAFGMNDCQISRLMGIPRGTIRDWRSQGRSRDRKLRERFASTACFVCSDETVDELQYVYLLGLYLGDGCLSACPRDVFKLRITLDVKYPGIIDECGKAIVSVRPRKPLKVGHVTKEGCTEVYSFWKHWPCVFPQHGPGRKHLRDIRLVDWQLAMVERHPDRLIRGLIHSDGCRFMNPVTTHEKRYEYVRYAFTNHSEQIREIFCLACDLLGIEWRQSRWQTISISKRTSVIKLDEIVGPKR